MSIINISNLSFAYDGSFDEIFKNVSLQIDTSWRLGVCGRNGRGKTTLLKLLNGQHEYSGTISADVKFEYFPYPIKDDRLDCLTILKNLTFDSPIWQIKKELFKLEMDEGSLYRPFRTLSNGEQTKAMLAGLFLRENCFLLIDEPTNHLDLNAREVVAQYLSRKSGFILVSHDRALLDGCTDHTLSINKNGIDIICGSFSVWQEQKNRKDAFELAQNSRLSRELERLQEATARTAKWSDKTEKSKKQALRSGLSADKGYIGHKSAKMMKRSKNIEKRRMDAAEEKSKLLKDIEKTPSLKIHPLSYHSPKLLSLKDVAIKYDGNEIFNGLSFSVAQGDRIALHGGNGSGKSSVLKLICGESIETTGEIDVGSQLLISYVPQDASFLEGRLSEYVEDKKIDETLFKAILRKLDFSREQFEKDMKTFSLGQKKKVLLAQSLCQRAHIYIWDEPLNYVDVQSRLQIEDLILEYRPTLIFVEHDKAFCNRIANKTVFLS